MSVGGMMAAPPTHICGPVTAPVSTLPHSLPARSQFFASEVC